MTRPARKRQCHKMIIKTVSRDRSKIVLEQEDQIKHWARHLDVTTEELARAVEKVGNSAAAVGKELAAVKRGAVITAATTKVLSLAKP